MTIELRLQEDNKTKKPFWSGQVKHESNVILQVVSQTFHERNDVAFQTMYENCTVRLMKELMKERDVQMLKHMLINNPT